MKEFIEKLIGRLEKEKSDWNYDYNVPIIKAIEIVNEVAEEHNNDFCEWKNGTSSVFPIKTNCGNSIDVNYGYEFCPYCGKKIKAVE